MALPVTITGISTTVAPVGPFKGAGAYYFFGTEPSGTRRIIAQKATDPTSSFSNAGDQNTAGNFPVYQLSAFQVGNIIHILAGISGGAGFNEIRYSAYDTSSDSWTVGPEAIATALTTNGQTGTFQTGVSLVVRSSGEVVAFYNGAQTKTSGTFRARVYYSRRTGVNTWSAAVQVDANTAVDNSLPLAALGASDRVHFVFYNQTNAIQRHLTSANVLGTAGTITSGQPQDICSVNDSGTIRHVCFTAAVAGRWDSADNPTISTAAITAGTPVRTVDDNLIVYALYQDVTTSDIYIRSSSNFGASFGSATSSLVGTVASAFANLSKNQTAYQRGSNVVFPYIVNDNGTLKYNEYTLRSVSLAYTLTADKGTFTETGVANKLAYGRVMPATVYAAALSGQTANLFYNRPLAVSAGAFTLSGPATGLRSDRRMAAAANAFSASFQTANLVYTHVPSSIQVSWAEVSGTEAAGAVAYVLTADTGTFALSGNSAGLIYSRKLSMAAAPGAFTLLGQPTTLRLSHVLSAVKGTFALSGIATRLAISRAVAAVAGAFALSGSTTRLATARRLGVTAGAFTLTGIPASLTKAGAYAISAVTGAFTLTGIAVNLTTILARRLTAATGAFLLNGTATRIVATRRLTADAGAFTLSGKAAGLLVAPKLIAATGAFVLSGKATGLVTGRRLIAGPGAFVLSGKPVNLVATVNKRLLADTGVFVLTGSNTALFIKTALKLAANVGAFTLNGSDAVFVTRHGIGAETGQFILVGTETNLRWGNHRLYAERGTFRLSGNWAELIYDSKNFHLPEIGQPGKMNYGRKVYAIPGRW